MPSQTLFSFFLYSAFLLAFPLGRRLFEITRTELVITKLKMYLFFFLKVVNPINVQCTTKIASYE